LAFTGKIYFHILRLGLDTSGLVNIPARNKDADIVQQGMEELRQTAEST